MLMFVWKIIIFNAYKSQKCIENHKFKTSGKNILRELIRKKTLKSRNIFCLSLKKQETLVGTTENYQSDTCKQLCLE